MNTVRPDRARLLRRKVMPVLDEFVRQSETSAGDFGRVESAAEDALARLRSLLVTAGLSAAAEEAPDFYCPDCAAHLSSWALGSRVIGTSQGDGAYPAVRYRCNVCGSDHYPVEEANGLERDQFTTGAKALVGERVAERVYTDVSKTLQRERGVSISAKEVDRTAREVAGWRRAEEAELAGSVFGKAAAKARLNETDPLAAAPKLYSLQGWEPGKPALISVDGAMVRSSTKGPEGLLWFESRAGLIAPAEENAPGNKFYIGAVTSPDALFDQLSSAWKQIGDERRPILFIGDGAKWIWDRKRLYFPEAEELLDIYHAGEHVASAAKALWGENSPTAKLWSSRPEQVLLTPGGPQSVLRALVEGLRVSRSGQPNTQPAANEAELIKEIRYLFGHRRRMWYARAKSRGLAVGSGAMESAIKQVCVSRLRKPGMKWTRDGADAVLALRGAVLSSTYSDTTDRKHASLQTDLQRYAKRPDQLAA